METVKRGFFFDPWWRFSIIFACIVEVCLIKLLELYDPEGTFTVVIVAVGFFWALDAYLFMFFLRDEEKPCQN